MVVELKNMDSCTPDNADASATKPLSPDLGAFVTLTQHRDCGRSLAALARACTYSPPATLTSPSSQTATSSVLPALSLSLQ